MSVAALVAALAVIQSLFGVGLLMFGTPTLLIAGYRFEEALAILLPASLTISALQVSRHGAPAATFRRPFAVWCLIPLGGALAIQLLTGMSSQSISVLITVLLGLFVMVRTLPAFAARLGGWSLRFERPWLLLMGTVHGLSNLGGALLLPFAASRHAEREALRGLVAFCYLSFVSVQLAVLVATRPSIFSAGSALYAALAGLIFVSIGDRTFRWLPRVVFERLLNTVCALYAVLLGLRAAGVW